MATGTRSKAGSARRSLPPPARSCDNCTRSAPSALRARSRPEAARAGLSGAPAACGNLTQMKKSVPVAELKMGMYVVELDRPWIETPFMYEGFYLESDEQLKTLKQYCKTVFVDPDPPKLAEPIALKPLAPARRPAAGSGASQLDLSRIGKVRYAELAPVEREVKHAELAYKGTTNLERGGGSGARRPDPGHAARRAGGARHDRERAAQPGRAAPLLAIDGERRLHDFARGRCRGVHDRLRALSAAADRGHQPAGLPGPAAGRGQDAAADRAPQQAQPPDRSRIRAREAARAVLRRDPAGDPGPAAGPARARPTPPRAPGRQRLSERPEGQGDR